MNKLTQGFEANWLAPEAPIKIAREKPSKEKIAIIPIA